MIWNSIEKEGNLSENFMREHKDNINWTKICRHQTLSENFILEMEDYIDFHVLLIYQTFSENFIEANEHLLHWDHIARFQPLSLSFIKKHIAKINYDKLEQNEDLSFTQQVWDEIKFLKYPGLKKAIEEQMQQATDPVELFLQYKEEELDDTEENKRMLTYLRKIAKAKKG